MGAPKRLTVEQMKWLAERDVSYEVRDGRECFTRKGFQVVENSDATYSLWNLNARPWTEDILSTDRSEPWENLELEAVFPSQRAALKALTSK